MKTSIGSAIFCNWFSVARYRKNLSSPGPLESCIESRSNPKLGSECQYFSSIAVEYHSYRGVTIVYPWKRMNMLLRIHSSGSQRGQGHMQVQAPRQRDGNERHERACLGVCIMSG